MTWGTRRFAPVARTTGMEQGLAARLADPLWMLARQWQMGELHGDDAGSVVSVRIDGVAHHPTWWRPEPDAADPAAHEWQPWSVADAPLEPLVEAEPADVATLRRLALRAAGQLRQRLVEAGLGHILAALAAQAPWSPPLLSGAADADRVAATALADPIALAQQVSSWAGPGAPAGAPPAELVAVLGLAAGEVDGFATTVRLWLGRWLAISGDFAMPAEPAEPTPNDPASWDPHRLEHRGSLAFASMPDVRLRIDRHPGGELDWFSADAVEGDPGELATAAAPTEALRAPQPFRARGVPLPAVFAGMPMPRFWEMEDAGVDYGNVDASPADLARKLLVAFTSTYGNDWLVQPLRLPVGALVAVESVAVTDSFGEVHQLTPFNMQTTSWRAFALHAPDTRPELGTHCYWSAPALTSSQQSAPLERVTLRRDEMSNTAWAVVERVNDTFARSRAVPIEVAPAPPATEPARYLVETPVASNWFPVVPEQIAIGSIKLTLRSVVPSHAGDIPARPLGRILAGPPGTWWLHEEELGRSGLILDRRVQLGRWHDGRRWRWTARNREQGAGQASSGLRWDVLADGT